MEARKNISEQMKQAARNAETKPFDGAELLWERVSARLDEEEKQPQPVAVPFFSQRKIAAIAAGLLLMIGLGTAYLISGKKEMPVADNGVVRNVPSTHEVPPATDAGHPETAMVKQPRTEAVAATSPSAKRTRYYAATEPGESAAENVPADQAAAMSPSMSEAAPAVAADAYQQSGAIAVKEKSLMTTERYIGQADPPAREIKSIPPGDITKAIEGAAPGVQVTHGSGQPGSSSSIQVRGRGSLSASTAPLIIVDGAPYEGDITSIDPADIASMSILKDAQAASLYGARGTNGVIVMVTKKNSVDYKSDTTNAAAAKATKKKHKIWNIRSWFRKSEPVPATPSSAKQ